MYLATELEDSDWAGTAKRTDFLEVSKFDRDEDFERDEQTEQNEEGR